MNYEQKRRQRKGGMIVLQKHHGSCWGQKSSLPVHGTPARNARASCGSFLLAEFGEQRLVRKKHDIFCKIVRCVPTLEFLLWFTRIYALQDAEPPEVLESHLRGANGTSVAVLGVHEGGAVGERSCSKAAMRDLQLFHSLCASHIATGTANLLFRDANRVPVLELLLVLDAGLAVAASLGSRACLGHLVGTSSSTKLGIPLSFRKWPHEV